MVDLFHLPYGTMLKIQKIDFLESDKYPHIKRRVIFSWDTHAMPTGINHVNAIGGGLRSPLAPRG